MPCHPKENSCMAPACNLSFHIRQRHAAAGNVRDLAGAIDRLFGRRIRQDRAGRCCQGSRQASLDGCKTACLARIARDIVSRLQNTSVAVSNQLNDLVQSLAQFSLIPHDGFRPAARIVASSRHGKRCGQSIDPFRTSLSGPQSDVQTRFAPSSGAILLLVVS